MYRRVVATVALAVFSLLAFVAGIVTDLHDRDFPQSVSAHGRLGLGFGDSVYTDREAFAALAQLDAEHGLGLVKIAPDLAGSADERVLVAVSDVGRPRSYSQFRGERAGTIVGPERLANSSPDGSYLVTGDGAGLAAAVTELREAGVHVGRTDASVAASLRFALDEGGFRTAVLAVLALVAALALFWLSIRAHARALRVLGGAPTLRIQAQDLGGLVSVLVLSAAAVTIAGAGYVAAAHGRVWVRPFVEALLLLEAGVLGTSMIAALALSAAAWPRAELLAARRPAVGHLRSVAAVVQVLTFLLLASSAGPSWAAHRNATASAAEAGQWRNLADRVAIQFGVSEQEMTDLEPQVGRVIADAERQGSLAFSYTFTQQEWAGDLGGWSAVSLVDEGWLDMFTSPAPADALATVPAEDVQSMLAREFGETLTLLSRDATSHEELLSRMDYRRPAGGFSLPVSVGGSGSLQFMDNVLVAVVPSVHGLINDRNLTSMISTRNIVFAGVAATGALLERHRLTPDALRRRGVAGELSIVYVAEEGILRAQFLEYVVWSTTLATGALAIAFLFAAAITAVIGAVLHAQRDFPLRLGGRSWAAVLRGRAGTHVLVGAGLLGPVAVLTRPENLPAVLAVALLGVLVVPFSHWAAARWTFARVTGRQL